VVVIEGVLTVIGCMCFATPISRTDIIHGDLFKFWGTKDKNIQENISLLFPQRNMGDPDNNIGQYTI